MTIQSETWYKYIAVLKVNTERFNIFHKTQLAEIVSFRRSQFHYTCKINEHETSQDKRGSPYQTKRFKVTFWSFFSFQLCLFFAYGVGGQVIKNKKFWTWEFWQIYYISSSWIWIQLANSKSDILLAEEVTSFEWGASTGGGGSPILACVIFLSIDPPFSLHCTYT